MLPFSGVACGRALPEDAPAATGPVETGAFELPADEQPAIEGVGIGASYTYLVAVGKALAAEDPTVRLRVVDEEPDYEALCAGEVDVAAATGDPDEDVCGGKDLAVGFRVATARGEPVVFYLNRDSLLQTFEVEGLIQYAVDHGESLPGRDGLEPLSIDELQETQTKLEQVVAGVG